MASQQKLTTMEEHFARHLKLHEKLAKAKGKSVSATIADMRRDYMSEGKVRTRSHSQDIMDGFSQEMKKARGQ